MKRHGLKNNAGKITKRKRNALEQLMLPTNTDHIYHNPLKEENRKKKISRKKRETNEEY